MIDNDNPVTSPELAAPMSVKPAHQSEDVVKGNGNLARSKIISVWRLVTVVFLSGAVVGGCLVGVLMQILVRSEISEARQRLNDLENLEQEARDTKRKIVLLEAATEEVRLRGQIDKLRIELLETKLQAAEEKVKVAEAHAQDLMRGMKDKASEKK